MEDKGLLFCLVFFPKKSGSIKAIEVTELEVLGYAVSPAWGMQPGSDLIYYSDMEEIMRKKILPIILLSTEAVKCMFERAANTSYKTSQAVLF